MAISSLTGTSSTSTATSSSAATAASQTSVDDAQSRFMKLLVTQMQNQDPMSPMDNAQLTTQIAQLNTVTGINQLNTTMQSMLTGVQSTQTLQATSLIGHSVLVPGTSTTLAQGKSVLGFELPQTADTVKLTVRDSNGTAVRTQTLGTQTAGQHSVSWDGTTDTGSTASDGSYSFEVQASSNGQQVTATTLTQGQVASVSIANGKVSLSIPAVGDVALADVRQVR